MADSDPSFRMAVRAATAHAHQRVDELINAVAPVGDQTGYTRFLQVMFEVMTEYAVVLDQSSSLAGLEPRSATLLQALRHDIDALGGGLVARPAPLSSDRGDGFLWGVGYVFEGSALGAEVLMGQLADAGSPPTAYLSLLTGDRVSRWVAFGAAMNASEADREEAATSARAVFDRIESATRIAAGMSDAAVPSHV